MINNNIAPSNAFSTSSAITTKHPFHSNNWRVYIPQFVSIGGQHAKTLKDVVNMSSGGIFPYSRYPTAEIEPKRRFTNRCKFFTVTTLLVIIAVVVGVYFLARRQRGAKVPEGH
jgi:hypothetical protein